MSASAINSAVQGLQANHRRLLDASGRISRWGGGGADVGAADGNPVGDVTDLLVSRRGYEANLLVVRAADEMLGALIDVLA